MISKPLTSDQVKELPNGYGYAPAYINRAERRKLERKSPRIKKLYESMAKNQTLDVNKALEKDKIETIVSESLSETNNEFKYYTSEKGKEMLQEVFKTALEKDQLTQPNDKWQEILNDNDFVHNAI